MKKLEMIYCISNKSQANISGYISPFSGQEEEKKLENFKILLMTVNQN